MECRVYWLRGYIGYGVGAGICGYGQAGLHGCREVGLCGCIRSWEAGLSGGGRSGETSRLG